MEGGKGGGGSSRVRGAGEDERGGGEESERRFPRFRVLCGGGVRGRVGGGGVVQPAFASSKIPTCRIGCHHPADSPPPSPARVELSHPRLRSFSLARCRGARGVTLACPALETVSLVECEELDTAELSVAVRKLSLGEGRGGAGEDNRGREGKEGRYCGPECLGRPWPR